jgi:hypothetical protein
VVLVAGLTAALVTGCGGDDDEGGSAAPTTSASPAETSASPTGADGGGTEGDGTPRPQQFPANTEPDTGEASADALVTVTDLRIGRHEGFDRVVFEVDGTGLPGWDVRYVDEPLGQGSGLPVEVEGSAYLQVDITGVGLPDDTGVEPYDGPNPLAVGATEVVTEAVIDSTFEGITQAFVGTTERVPFRVYLLEDPARVVLEVVHDG